ncbi:Alpha/beta hydrolase fold-3 domain-containing protein [Madurella fahalii]|uniref:Alpha/beta hydrolase fold-3 domain-containing protein n=1 Tax=Madurella fahalii TaxID=1157608 RepID=A0ABQ0GL96_9PEZI
MADIVAATTAPSALDTAGGGDAVGMVVKRLPLGQRIKLGFLAYAWARLIRLIIFFQESKKYFMGPADNEPDLVKTYPALKSLPIRIFFPPSYSSSSGKKLPTLLTLHGGGFTVGTPHYNDTWNRAFARTHNFLVVALNYSKAPGSPFPGAIEELEVLIPLVLADASLPVDARRVAVGGFSAGGNLALAAAQRAGVRGRVAAAVPLYPVVDFVAGEAGKARARRYKPALGGFRARERDFLLAMNPIFNWAYLPPGLRRDHPLLSPFYADPDALPPNIFTIACEMDLLAPEAQRMMCKLAGRRVPGLEEVIGQEGTAGKGELITEGDDRFSWEEETPDGRRYKWLLVPDTIHGFDQDNIAGLTKDRVLLEDAWMKRDKVIKLIGEWLLDGPLKKKDGA